VRADSASSHSRIALGGGPIAVAVAGAAGRLGGAVLRRLATDPRFAVAACLERPGHAALGRSPLGEVAGLPPCVADEGPWGAARVLLDAGGAGSVAAHVRRAAGDGIGIVVAVTGLPEEAERELDAAARRVAVLASPNLSLGVTVLAGLVREAARRLAGYDVEIVEAHHAAKRDSPSGTALWLGREAATARGWPWPQTARAGREGVLGPRPEREIGIHSLRGGSVVGEHRVSLAGAGEHLELAHIAESRDCFAAGALEALALVARSGPGRYTMEDVTAGGREGRRPAG
jgi:4-hydroxy-tetrahydrodipicolinate reductase